MIEKIKLLLDDYFSEYHESNGEAAEAIMALFDNKWIKVSDRLPDIDQKVLLFTDSGIIEGNRTDGEYSEWDFIHLDAHGCGCCSRDSDEVTHWQPLLQEPE